MPTFTLLNLLKDTGLQNKFAQVKANDKYFNIKNNNNTFLGRMKFSKEIFNL